MSLQITNSELSMELEEAQARIQVIEETMWSEYQAEAEESNLTEPAQLRLAIMDLTSEKEQLYEKLTEAKEKLSKLMSLQIIYSELSMELEEAQSRIQVIKETMWILVWSRRIQPDRSSPAESSHNGSYIREGRTVRETDWSGREIV